MGEVERKSIDSGDFEAFTSFPIARGMYIVTSESHRPHVVDMNSYTVSNGWNPVCECEDYKFRKGSEGNMCKHVEYVDYCIKHGFLPPKNAFPKEWIKNKIDEEVSEYDDETREMIESPYQVTATDIYYIILEK